MGISAVLNDAVSVPMRDDVDGKQQRERDDQPGCSQVWLRDERPDIHPDHNKSHERKEDAIILFNLGGRFRLHDVQILSDYKICCHCPSGQCTKGQCPFSRRSNGGGCVCFIYWWQINKGECHEQESGQHYFESHRSCHGSGRRCTEYFGNSRNFDRYVAGFGLTSVALVQFMEK